MKEGGRSLKCTLFFSVLESDLEYLNEGCDQSIFMDMFQGINKLPEINTKFMPIYLFLLFSHFLTYSWIPYLGSMLLY